MTKPARDLAVPVLSLVSMVLAACGPAAGPAIPDSGAGEPRSAAPPRTLAVAICVEPPTVATRPLQTVGISLYFPSRMCNAQMGLLDKDGNSYPYVVEALPQLNTDSWRLFADGRMETTYRLKPNAT